MEEAKNILETALENLPGVHEVDRGGESTPFAFVPNGMRVEDLSEFLPGPRRIQSSIIFSDVAGFMKYVNAFKTESTVLFPNLQFVKAVFDYHDKDRPNWCEHKATFQMTHTPEWLEWQRNQKLSMTQAAFANFLESLIPTIIKPSAVDVLQVVRSIRATVTNRSVSVVNDDGVNAHMEYKRDVEVKGAGSIVDLPRQLEIKLSPYIGIDIAYILNVRLKYEVLTDASGVKFSYEILGLERALQDTFEELVGKIERNTEVTSFIGATF